MIDLHKTKEALDKAVVSAPAITLKSVVDEIKRLQKVEREYQCVMAFLMKDIKVAFDCLGMVCGHYVTFDVDRLNRLIDGFRNDN